MGINSEPSYELDEDNFRLVISLEQSKQFLRPTLATRRKTSFSKM